MALKGTFLWIVCFGLSLCRLYGQSSVYLYGNVLDNDKSPGPFVNLVFRDDYFQELVVTDVNGEFTIRLRPNSRYWVTVNDPRYKRFSVKLMTADKDFRWTLPVTWKKSNLNDAYYQADTSKNPADKIVKETIRKRNLLLNQVREYSADAHLYSTMEVTKVKSNYPRWWLWSVVPDSSQVGINNLKEVYSRVHVRNLPKGYKEEVQSIRRAGKELELDFAAHTILQINLYEGSVPLLHYNEMQYISPLSWGAFVFYKYELAEKYFYEGEEIYRIKVTPKNKYNRTFRGEIHIASNSFSLVKAELTAPKSSGLQKVDSVHIHQEFVKISPDVWMPSYFQVTAWNRLYGAHMYYRTDVTYSGHDFRPAYHRGFFRQELLSADTNDIDYNRSSWEELPGYHITDEEENYFLRSDSVMRYQQYKRRHLDSLFVNRKKKNFHWTYPVFGHTVFNDIKQKSFYYDGIINDKMEYNTVEGFAYKYTVYYRKRFRNSWQLDIEPTVRFGFSDLRPKAKVNIGFGNEWHAQKFYLEGGSYYFQINQSEPIDPIINTFYTIFLRRNFMKLYRKEYVRAAHERELLNGLYFHASMEFANRSTVENSASWSLIRWPGVDFTPNNPNSAIDSTYRLSNNKAFKVKVGFTYKPKQQYLRFARRKVVLGSVFPAVSLFYTRGIPWVLGSQVSYDLLELTVTDDIYFRLIGKSSYIVKGGVYLTRGRMTFLDYTHFIGEQGFFLGSSVNGTYLDQFRALDYFTYSTNYPFIEIHYQHDFKGFLLNQIPGIKILKWNPLVGLNYLQLFDPDRRSYLEVFVGVDNVLGALKFAELFNVRVDVAMQLKDGVDVVPQLLIGVATKFDRMP